MMGTIGFFIGYIMGFVTAIIVAYGCKNRDEADEQDRISKSRDYREDI